MESRQADIEKLGTEVDRLGIELTILRHDLSSFWKTTNALGEGRDVIGNLRSRTQELSDVANELFSKADRIGESRISSKVDSIRQSVVTIRRTVDSIGTIAKMNRRKAIAATALVILGIVVVAILRQVLPIR